jgi:hypothetical protein
VLDEVLHDRLRGVDHKQVAATANRGPLTRDPDECV